MKNLKMSKLMLVVLLFIAFSSCQKETISKTIKEESAQANEMNKIDEQTDNIIENVYLNEESAQLTGKSSVANSPSNVLASCVTITNTLVGMTKTVVIDFGTSCTLNSGDIVSGIITIVYSKDTAALTKDIVGSFSNFVFNNKSIVGGKTIHRERFNSNNNPQSTITRDFTVTWPNGETASREGTKIREWILGVFSGVWSDNVYLISGNWTNTFKNGNIHTGDVIIPLRRELTCAFFVSGTVDVVRTNYSGVLNFGTGACDNQAIFTEINGTIHNITLQ